MKNLGKLDVEYIHKYRCGLSDIVYSAAVEYIPQRMEACRALYGLPSELTVSTLLYHSI